MKKISSIYIVSFVLLVFFTTSCNEDEFLSIAEPGAITSDNYLSTEEEVESAVFGAYNKLQTLESNDSWTSLYFVKNLPADDCLAGSSAGDQTDYQNLDDFEIGADNTKIKGVWTNLYALINRVNTVINDADPTMSDYVEEMIAECKAIRGFCYLELVTMFGGVPIRTVNAVETEEYHLARSTVDEVYAQIEADFTDAIASLPLKSEYASSDKFRMSKGAAQAFLGKAYLYQEKYSSAVSMFEAVMSSGEYDLNTPFDEVWKKDYEFGSESLFEVSYTAGESYTWGTYSWDNTEENNIELQLEGPRSSIFVLSNSTLSSTLNNGWGFNMPSAKIAEAYENADDTVRGSATVMSEADFIATGGEIVDGIEAFVTHDYEGYMRTKYATWASETDGTATSELNYTTNWRLLRYADVLLMAAEAYYFSDNEPDALDALNLVRERAGLDDEDASGADLFDAIVLERQLELSFEGCRYWDLVRWDLAEEEMSDIGFVSGKHELFPIPQDEIDSNNEIDSDEQNPGY